MLIYWEQSASLDLGQRFWYGGGRWRLWNIKTTDM